MRKRTPAQIAALRDERARLDAAVEATLADPAILTEVRAQLEATAESVRTLGETDQIRLVLQARERGFALSDVAPFDLWKARDRSVIAGETSLRLSGGAPVFDVGQTHSLTEVPEPAGHDDTEPATSDAAPGEQPQVATSAAGPEPTAFGEQTEHAVAAGFRIERSGRSVEADLDTSTIYIPARLSDDAAAIQLAGLLPALIAATADTTPAASPVEDQVAAVVPITTRARAIERVPEPEPVAAPPDNVVPFPGTRRGGSALVQLPLGEHYGVATVRMSTNWELGRTLYQVTGPRVSGSFTVVPIQLAGEHDAVPEGIEVYFGDLCDGGNRFVGNRPYPAAPVVHDITVTGLFGTTADTVRSDRFRTNGSRSTADYSSELLPGKTQHWLSRDDLNEVRLAAARHEAPHRMFDELATVRELDEKIARLTALREEHAQYAEDFRALTSLPGQLAAVPDLPAPPGTCLTPDCSGNAEDGDGWDGLCGACTEQVAADTVRDAWADVDIETAVATENVLATQYPDELGPQWSRVAVLIERSRHLTAGQLQSLNTVKPPAEQAAFAAAQRAAIAVVLDAGRDDGYRLARKSPAGSAAVAVMVRDLLPYEHYRVLTAPLARVLGHQLHPDDAQLSETR